MSVVEKEEDGRVPSGFDPSRYEGKPRWLDKREKRLLRSLLDALEDRMALMADHEQDVLLSGCLNVSPINCAWDEYALAKIIYHSLSHDVVNRDSDGNPEGGDGTAPSHSDDSAGRQASPISRGAALDGEG